MKFEVAKHIFELKTTTTYHDKLDLSQYKPFILEDNDKREPLFTLYAEEPSKYPVDESQLVAAYDEDFPAIYVYKNEKNYYLTLYPRPRKRGGVVVFSEDFKEAHLYPRNERPGVLLYAVNNSLMLQYAFCTAAMGTLMMHASVVRHAGYANLFLGKSGAGKSTQSRMWLENIPETELINDDNPVVRVIDNQAIVFGSPWSGKTPCYKNTQAPIRSFVSIKQAPYNKITRQDVLHAYAALLTSVSIMQWQRTIANGINDTLDKLLRLVPGYTLECLADAEAAQVCRKEVEGA